MAGNFSVLNSPDGPTAVFYAGKLGNKSLFPVGIAILAVVMAAAAILFFKKRK